MSGALPQDLIRVARIAADSYVDTTAQWATLSAALSDIIDAVRANYQLDAGVAATEAQEREFFTTHGYANMTVDDLLNTAIRTNDIFVERLFGGDAGATLTAGLLDICITPSGLAFLPPDEGEISKGDGTTAWELPKFDYNRLPQVLSALCAMDIRLDKLIIYQGQGQPNQIRQKPYDVIEVLTKGVQIAVCPQIGEALFVLPKPSTEFTTLDWARTGKDALESEHGATRVVMTGDWVTKLQDVVSGRLFQASVSIKSAKSNARQNRIVITDKMRSELFSEMHRTGFGPKLIYNGLKDAGELPDLLSLDMIKTWIDNRDGFWQSATCFAECMQAVFAHLKKQPTICWLDEKENPEDALTWRERLQSEMKRTDIRSKAIHAGLVAAGKCPEGLKPKTIEIFVYKPSNGDYPLKTCSLEHVCAALDFLIKQPTAKPTVRLDDKENPEDTQTWRERLISETNRTGIYAKAIHNAFVEAGKIRSDFGPKKIESLIRKTKKGKKEDWMVKFCEVEYVKDVLDLLAKKPDAKPTIVLDEKQNADDSKTWRERLQDAIVRTGLNHEAMYKGLVDASVCPDDLNAHKIYNISYKRNGSWVIKNFPREHADAILTFCASFSSKGAAASYASPKM